MNFVLVSSSDGDWAGLYINGTLAEPPFQGHSLQVDEVINGIMQAVRRIEKVNHYHLSTIEVDMEDMVGGLPYNLNDIPQEARV
jgi:hypothetical protein